jgi:hypothetical protein
MAYESNNDSYTPDTSLWDDIWKGLTSSWTTPKEEPTSFITPRDWTSPALDQPDMSKVMGSSSYQRPYVDYTAPSYFGETTNRLGEVGSPYVEPDYMATIANRLNSPGSSRTEPQEEQGWWDRGVEAVEQGSSWMDKNKTGVSAVAGLAALLMAAPAAKKKAAMEEEAYKRNMEQLARTQSAQARSNSPLLSTGQAPSVMNRQFLGLAPGMGDTQYSRSGSPLRNAAIFSKNKLG